MSRGLNMVQLIGNLGDDPEFVTTPSGTNIATLRIATSEKWTDKDGNQQERTEWHRVKYFGRVAEVCSEYLKKGSKIYVQGKIRTEKWTDNAGVERWSTDVIGEDMQMLGGTEGGGERAQRPQQAAGQQQQQQRSAGNGQGARPAGNGNGGNQAPRGNGYSNGNGGGNGGGNRQGGNGGGGGYQQRNQPGPSGSQSQGDSFQNDDIPF